jgi:hypothetical protein
VRKELKSLTEQDYWCYGLSENDFDYTIRLVDDLIGSNQEVLKRKIEKAKIEYPQEDIWGEIQSDLAHYAWVDQQYLWQFSLWRLQGIFEGLILHDFLPVPPKKKLIGLRSKLNAAKEAGFSLSPEEEKELISWGNLRNALSHAPPEQYRPGPVQKDDILEYVAFIKSVCSKWRAYKNTL